MLIKDAAYYKRLSTEEMESGTMKLHLRRIVKQLVLYYTVKFVYDEWKSIKGYKEFRIDPYKPDRLDRLLDDGSEFTINALNHISKWLLKTLKKP